MWEGGLGYRVRVVDRVRVQRTRAYDVRISRKVGRGGGGWVRVGVVDRVRVQGTRA